MSPLCPDYDIEVQEGVFQAGHHLLVMNTQNPVLSEQE
jgi:hypothetical protein